MTDRSLLLRAAEWIAQECGTMRTTLTNEDGEWGDEAFEDDYIDGLALVSALRREAGE